MRYSILILVLSISVGLYAKEWEQDSTAIISEEKITTLNNTTYTNITIKGTWTDNFGHYGIYKCNANSVKNSETVKLEGICEGENEHQEKYWYKLFRNSSSMEAGVGRIIYLDGTGIYKNLKGLKCNYGVRYLKKINYVKSKCDISKKIESNFMKLINK